MGNTNTVCAPEARWEIRFWRPHRTPTPDIWGTVPLDIDQYSAPVLKFFGGFVQVWTNLVRGRPIIRSVLFSAQFPPERISESVRLFFKRPVE